MKKLVCILLAAVLILAAAVIGYSAGMKQGEGQLSHPEDPTAEQTDGPAAEQTEATVEQTEDSGEETDPVIQYLERLSRSGESVIEDDNLVGLDLYLYLYHYQVQSDGHGLAMMVPADGDMSGNVLTTLYETTDGGKSWEKLSVELYVAKGYSDVVYMGEAVVIAAANSKIDNGFVYISYDRGHTWNEIAAFDELIDYDPEQFCLNPHIINYNADSGMITFGWMLHDSDDYVLINQFDVRTCRVVEELYRSPDFPRR